MEILQTIWNALTTENLLLIQISYIPMTIIEVTVTTLLFTTILSISSTAKQKLLYIFSFSSIAILSIFFIPTPFNTFVNIIFSPILVYFIFNTSILKAIVSQFIPYVFFVLVGNILLKFYLSVFNISTDIALNIPIYKMSYSLIMYLIVFLIYLLFKKFNINISLYKILRKNTNRALIINFLIGFITFAIQSYTMTIYSNYIPFYLNLATISVFLTYFISTLYSLSRSVKLESTTERLEEEKLYNKTLTILYDNIRGFKHDFNNIVQAIGGYVATNNIDGLKEYYSDLMDDCQKVNNLAILNPELINNHAIYSLLTSKYHKAEEIGITMNFDIFVDLKSLNIKTYDLSRILGVLLDNAIEASSKCKEKLINISIKKDNKSNRHLFIIENTYENKNVDTDRIFEKGYTSKDDDGKSHGLGLWEVRKILKKNNNLNLFTTKDKKLFKQQLEIYY